MKQLIIPALLLAASSAATAAQPSYSFVQASLVKTEIAELESFSPTGFELTGSVELGHNIFAEYEYRDVSDTVEARKLDTTQEQLSIGYIHNISSTTTFDYRAVYGKFAIKGSTPTESTKVDTDYFGLAANVRYRLTADFEVFGGLEAQNWDGDADQKAYKLGALYDFWGFLAGLEYTKYSDQEIFAVNVRYAF